jgi:hypothetical protein
VKVNSALHEEILIRTIQNRVFFEYRRRSQKFNLEFLDRHQWIPLRPMLNYARFPPRPLIVLPGVLFENVLEFLAGLTAGEIHTSRNRPCRAVEVRNVAIDSGFTPNQGASVAGIQRDNELSRYLVQTAAVC